MKNTIFTNVGETSDGFIYWEAMEEPNQPVTTWKNETYVKVIPFKIMCERTFDLENFNKVKQLGICINQGSKSLILI